MSEVINCCVILHNMIIESERDDPMDDNEAYYRQGPITDIDHQVSETWTNLLNMRQEIRDSVVPKHLQNDSVEHM